MSTLKNTTYNVEDVPSGFLVCSASETRCAKFSLANGQLEVTSADGSIFRVSLTLNDRGECRYQINQQGEYLRWHVTRKALHALFF